MKKVFIVPVEDFKFEIRGEEPEEALKMFGRIFRDSPKYLEKCFKVLTEEEYKALLKQKTSGGEA